MDNTQCGNCGHEKAEHTGEYGACEHRIDGWFCTVGAKGAQCESYQPADLLTETPNVNGDSETSWQKFGDEIGTQDADEMLRATTRPPETVEDEMTCDGVYHYTPTPEPCGHEGKPCPLPVLDAIEEWVRQHLAKTAYSWSDKEELLIPVAGNLIYEYTADLTTRLTQAETANAVLRKVVEHYADGENWTQTDQDNGQDCDIDRWYMGDGNGYDTAQAAIKAVDAGVE